MNMRMGVLVRENILMNNNRNLSSPVELAFCSSRWLVHFLCYREGFRDSWLNFLTSQTFRSRVFVFFFAHEIIGDDIGLTKLDVEITVSESILFFLSRSSCSSKLLTIVYLPRGGCSSFDERFLPKTSLFPRPAWLLCSWLLRLLCSWFMTLAPLVALLKLKMRFVNE